MDRLAAFLPLLLFAATTTAGPALAATADHQQCYKIKDAAASAKYTADLVPSDPGFPVASGCVVKVPAKLLCIDVEKTNVVPAPPGAAAGQPAQKSLCYKVKCPSLPAPLSVVETDQFAAHTLTVKKSFLLCAPVPAPPATTTTTLPSGCATDGDCPPLPNATAACSASTCVIGVCDPGYADCNGLASDGCEVDTTSTPAHCGGCNVVCTFPNANASCTSSTCGIGSCAQDYADCNFSNVDGCETYLGTDPSNCGGCGNVCPISNPNCVASTCVP